MQLTLPECDVLCIYGIPDAPLLHELREWVQQEDRYLVIFDESKPVDFDDPRILFSDLEEASIRAILWRFVFLKVELLEVCDSGKKSLDRQKQLAVKLTHLHGTVHLVASDFADRGINFIHNFQKNFPRLSEAIDARKLFGGFKDVPAVICGAGVSLEKEVPYLRTLKDRALLFAGGTAMSSLAQFDLKPHFGGDIDPHQPTERFFCHQAFEVPAFFQSRAHPNRLDSLQGQLLWVPGSGNDLFEAEAFEGGWNVATFLTALACHMGCNPIILVGVDLAHKGEKVYAGDLTREEEEEWVELDGGLRSKRDWLYAAKWLSEFASKHPEVTWINASDGLSIEGFDQGLLHEYTFDRQEDLAGEVHSRLELCDKGVEVDFDLASFERVGQLCGKMLQLLEKLFPEPPEKNGEYALLLFDLEKEQAYEQFFSPIWGVWKHVFKRELAADIPEAYGIELNKWLFIRGICDEARNL